MRISVLTPDRQIFEGNITSVRLPGTDGQFQVLENHAPWWRAFPAAAWSW